jgi:hypothetical protein
VCARYPGVPFRVNERREETARRRLRRRLRMCSLAHQQGCRATAREPLSLKLANARRLAGCGGVHGMGGTLRVGMDFEIRPPLFWSSACRTPHAVHATQPVVLSSRHSPLRFGGACTPSRDLLDPRIAPARRAPETATAPSRRPGPASGPQSPTMLILASRACPSGPHTTNAQQC